ncbi:MAG TPA: uroporphyrinogen-III C-methyltransferase [Casimicrobiaceae bacterium]|nr:uroporphyrinogen-III C-methyltransferase [Casimicrobiaceae bacterium]
MSVEPPSPAAAPPSERTWVSHRTFAGVLLVLIALGFFAWLDAQRNNAALREETARRLTLGESVQTQAKDREARIAAELRDAQAKLALLETRLAESQSQQAALEALYRELAPSRDDLALNEVEQILLIANQQLALAGNVSAALAGLQLADAKLARIDRPVLGPLRRTLARDVDRLRALPFIDVGGIAQKLDQSVSLVDTLPLARDERLPAPKPTPLDQNEPAWRRLVDDIVDELRSLVRLETSARPAAPLIAPGEAYFLRENLRLRLVSARIAILARQEASYKADVRTSREWLRQYFDTRTKPVQGVMATLDQMLAAPLPDDLPDLAASLDAVRTLKAAQERRLVPPIPARPNR